MSGATVIAFPPRHPGHVLEQALAAAFAAGEGAALAHPAASPTPWDKRDEMSVRAAAYEAAYPTLRTLTCDDAMASVLGFGMVEEVVHQLRRRGLA